MGDLLRLLLRLVEVLERGRKSEADATELECRSVAIGTSVVTLLTAASIPRRVTVSTRANYVHVDTRDNVSTGSGFRISNASGSALQKIMLPPGVTLYGISSIASNVAATSPSFGSPYFSAIMVLSPELPSDSAAFGYQPAGCRTCSAPLG